MGAMNVRDSLLACLVALVWGFNFVVIAWGLEGLSPLLFVALRFVLVLFPAVFLVARPVARFRDVAKVGLFMSLGQFALVYTSIHLGLSAGLASLVLQAQAIFTIILAALWLHERPTFLQAVGVSVGMVGLLVVGLGRSGTTPLVALLVCVGGALSWGLGNVLTRRLGIPSGLSLTVWSGVVVPLPLLALATMLDGPASVTHEVAAIDATVLATAAFSAFLASLVGYSIFNSLLARHPASAVIPFTLLVPPVGMASAWLLLDETPNAYELLGGAVLLAGVAVTLVRRPPALGVRRPAVLAQVGER
jgi:O-acetylserine/cysteine efflux transporter